jgi:hypothetical protein
VALAFNQPYSSLLAVPVVGVVEDTHRVYLRSLLPWLLLAGGVEDGVHPFPHRPCQPPGPCLATIRAHWGKWSTRKARPSFRY